MKITKKEKTMFRMKRNRIWKKHIRKSMNKKMKMLTM